jgi:hypothetical protein
VEGESLVRLAQAGSAPLQAIAFLENPKLNHCAKQHSWKNVTRNDRKSRVVAEIHVRVGNPFMWHRPGSCRHVRAARKQPGGY